MSRGATLSILGLYQFDNTILDSMVLPVGVDKTILFPDLLAECAEFEILYPDPDVFKTVLTSWSNHRCLIWNRIYELTQLEYNPIENYDRQESWTDSGTNGEISGGTQKNYQAGFNTSVPPTPPDIVQQEQIETNNHSNSSGQTTHNGRVHGNIGTVTTQDMMEQEIAISDKIDIYNYIISDFKKRFCIPLY